MMKSDKAVCTNDTTMEDLGRALTYEAIFSTLIENKVLAIKRDCEERKRAKRQKRKSFGRILFSKKIFGSSTGRKGSPSPEDVEQGSEAGDLERDVTSQLADCHIHDETASKASSRRHHQEPIANDIEEVSQAAAPLRKARNASKAPQSQLYQEDDSIASNAYNESLSLSEKNGGASSLVGGVRNLVVEVLTHHHDTRCTYDDEGSLLGPTTSIPLTDDATVGQNFDAISLGSNSNHMDENNTSTMADDSLTSIRDSIESLSFPSSRCTVSVSGFAADAVCPEITVNPSCLESASLIFDKSRAKRLRILEAKSISAQNSPTLPRHIKPGTATRTTCLSTSHGPARQQEKTQHPHHQVSFSNGTSDERPGQSDAAMKLFSRQNTSEDSANLTMSTLLNEGEEAHASHDLGRKSKSASLLIISHKSSHDNLKKQTLSSRLDSNNRSTVNQTLAPRGDSYIAYTTTSSYFPVITMTTTTAAATATATAAVAVAVAATTPAASTSASNGGGGSSVYATPTDEFVPAPSAIVPSATLPSDTAKLHRMTSTSTGSSVAPTGCCATKSRDKEKRFKPSWPSGQSGSDDEYRKRKRKYKRHHRCSDPVLVYPSASGLQHCILSMPPNQPIQFHYNEDFVYDMTLQVESDKNDDLQEIVPSSRNRKHRHHKHKKRHRHKKPKILVHDLDTRMVKVIDPDDLPQRARWTIIATAFLLLLMCLMLVGITLRMAPIIDDMECRVCQMSDMIHDFM